MTTALFWRRAVERAVKTAAQSALATLGADGLGVMDVDWATTGSVAGLAAVLSLLTSVASSRSGDGESPSLVE